MRRALLAAAALASVAGASASAALPPRQLQEGSGQCDVGRQAPDVVAINKQLECQNCSLAWASAKDTCHKAGGRESWATAMEKASVHSVGLQPVARPSVCDNADYSFEPEGEKEVYEAKTWFKAHVAVYVLNLEKDTRRWEKISGRLSHLGIPFERIPGVDLTAPAAFKAARWEGLLPDSFNFTKAEDRFNNTRPGGGGITGTVGCAAAHLRAMRIVSQLQGENLKPLAIILEDDVKVADNFQVMLWRLLHREAPCDWEVIALQSMCPYGACVSEHLTRVLPASHHKAKRCEAGVNLGFSGMLYRVAALDDLRSKLASAVWDDENPGCLDVDVALASLADKTGYYAVPGSLAKGLIDTEADAISSRLEFNHAFAGWSAWNGGLSGGARFRSRADEYWEVVSGRDVEVRQGRSASTDLLSVKKPGQVIRGLKEGDWVNLVSEPGYVRISDAISPSAHQLRQAEPIYDFWNPAQLDHTFHAGGPWLGEEKGPVQFSVFPESADGTNPVYRFSAFFTENGMGRLEYTFHMGEAREGEVRQGVEFHAFSYEAPGTEPVYEFWHESRREHSLHLGSPWLGEVKKDIQFWAYPPLSRSQKEERAREREAMCYAEDVTYQPLLVMVPLEPELQSPAGCQAACKANKQCTYFSYFPWDKTCHLAEGTAYKQQGSLGAISGPRDCSGHAGKSHGQPAPGQPAGWVASMKKWSVADAITVGPHVSSRTLVLALGLGILGGGFAFAALALTYHRVRVRSASYVFLPRPPLASRQLLRAEAGEEVAEVEDGRRLPVN